MANQLATNPWVIDTAATTVLFRGNILVDHFEFVGYTLDTDTCVVKNRFGTVVWQGDGASDLEEVRSGHVGWIEGLAVTTIGGNGTVRVFFK